MEDDEDDEVAGEDLVEELMVELLLELLAEPLLELLEERVCLEEGVSGDMEETEDRPLNELGVWKVEG